MGVTINKRMREMAKVGQILKREGNKRCADCNCRGPSWASTGYGVLVCIRCAGEIEREGRDPPRAGSAPYICEECGFGWDVKEVCGDLREARYL